MLDDLLKLLIEFSGLVIQRRHVCIPSHVLSMLRDVTDESVEPTILIQGNLGMDYARLLIEEAGEGATFPIDQLDVIEVLLDHRRTCTQSTLIEHQLTHVDELLAHGRGIFYAAMVGVLLRDDLQSGENSVALVALSSHQVDVTTFGGRFERLQRFVAVVGQKASERNDEHRGPKAQTPHSMSWAGLGMTPA